MVGAVPIAAEATSFFPDRHYWNLSVCRSCSWLAVRSSTQYLQTLGFASRDGRMRPSLHNLAYAQGNSSRVSTTIATEAWKPAWLKAMLPQSKLMLSRLRKR
jgi:hypothetical protein